MRLIWSRSLCSSLKSSTEAYRLTLFCRLVLPLPDAWWGPARSVRSSSILPSFRWSPLIRDFCCAIMYSSTGAISVTPRGSGKTFATLSNGPAKWRCFPYEPTRGKWCLRRLSEQDMRKWWCALIWAIWSAVMCALERWFCSLIVGIR